MKSIVSILENKEGFAYLKGVTDEQIIRTEETLEVRFAKDYREYVSRYGIASFYGHELTGICKSPRLNVVDTTRIEIENNQNIPRGFYVVEQLNIDDVVIWQSENGDVFQTIAKNAPEKISDSLCEYIQSL